MMTTLVPRVVVAGLLLAADAARADEVVMVTSTRSEVRALSSLQMRELFLGHRVQIGRQRLRGAHVSGDERLDRIFLQYVMAMSAESYERRLLAMSLQTGRFPPTRVASERELLQLLRQNASYVGFCWRSSLDGDPDLRVLRVVWRE